MTLAAGTRLGPYEILAPIGAGGMGEVYKAKDTRLERTVAVKVLPTHMASTPETRQRFEREAKTISQLSHPHICALYDVGREGETEYLVMELLEGETLSDRLAKGSLPLEQTLRYGTEIADALDKAHRQGIVHRDLKPGNVMITKSGVKLLDFGLAKAMAPAAPAGSLTSLPTQQGLTQEGTILGTFQYMAPEQLEGKEAGARTDIFAFGCVLYEMATGRKAFSGASRASLVTAILSADPPAISSVQAMSPVALDRVVKKCLAKDPEDRWQSAADLGSELRWIGEGGSQAGMTVPVIPRSRRREWLAWSVAAMLLLAVGASLFTGFRRGREPAKPIRFFVASPEGTEFFRTPAASSLALSPDGSSLAFVAATGARTSLWVRPLGALTAAALKDTEGAISPFWSPDGRFIGFFAHGKLQKIAAAGGPPQVLCESDFGNGATWGRDGTILFAERAGGREGLWRISDQGGTPARVGSVDGARGENTRDWPYFLPDGRHFLYVSAPVRASQEEWTVWAGSLDSRETRRIMAAGSRVAYCDPGYLLFARDGALLAQAFDPGALRVTGDPIPVSDNVWLFRGTGNAAFTVSKNGDVAYQAGSSPAQMTWRDRSGREIGAVGAPAVFRNPRLSPDGSSIAVEVADPRTGGRDVWIYDAQRGLPRRFTTELRDAVSPVWSPAGDRIAFGPARTGNPDLYVKSVIGTGTEQLLLEAKGTQFPRDWSPDGSRILYEDFSPARSAQRQLWVLPLTEKASPTLLLATQFSAFAARYSPDGGWIAFVSEESGSSEVYVVTATGQGQMRRVSLSGGSLPHWRGDGKELFYLAPNGDLVAVPTETKGEFRAGDPSVLFAASPAPLDYDVFPDGRRFLFLEHARERDVPLTVVVNWAAELKSR